MCLGSNRALDGSDAVNNGVFNVWATKSDGSAATPLTHLTTVAHPGETSNPVFSPDGSKIAFSSGAGHESLSSLIGFYVLLVLLDWQRIFVTKTEQTLTGTCPLRVSV